MCSRRTVPCFRCALTKVRESLSEKTKSVSVESRGRIGSRPALGGASSPPPAPSRTSHGAAGNHTCALTHAHACTHMHAHTCTHACTLEPPTQPWPRDHPGVRSENTDFLLRSPCMDLAFGHVGGNLCASFSYAALPFLPPMLLTASPLSHSLSLWCCPGSCRGSVPGPWAWMLQAHSTR